MKRVGKYNYNTSTVTRADIFLALMTTAERGKTAAGLADYLYGEERKEETK